MTALHTKPFRALALTVSAISLSAIASEWIFEYRPAEVRYASYGGTLSDPVAPAKGDSKAAFEVKGSAAKELFDAIGPDRRDACSSGPGVRFRSKDAGKFVCLKIPDSGYACYFGFDLKTGKSVGGSIC